MKSAEEKRVDSGEEYVRCLQEREAVPVEGYTAMNLLV